MYRKKSSEWLKHWDFELLDIIGIEIAFMVAYLYRHMDGSMYMVNMYARFSFWLAIFDIAVLFFSKNYDGILQRDKWKELLSSIKHISVVEMCLIIYVYITKEAFLFSRTVFFVSWGIAIVLCWLLRCAWKKVIRKKIMIRKNQSRILLVSSAERFEKCMEGLYRKDYRDYYVSAVSTLKGTVTESAIEKDVQKLSGKDEAFEYARTNIVDEVFIDYYENENQLNEMIDTFLAMGITVHVGMSNIPDDLPNQTMQEIGDCNAITTTIKMANEWELALKRFTDICGALVGLLFTGIAIVFVGPAIKIASPGPIFFKQERVGKNGRIFHIYKFRSMYMDAEERKKELMDKNEMSGLMFKMENDPRIIGSEKGPGKGLGNFIRKTSIDELPQFWNILVGDMSLVGTRPPTKNEYEQYDLHHKIRLGMKPGLTGMWQVSGRSDITDFEEIVGLDAEYIENWSVGLDLKILFKTVGVVLFRKGSK